MGFSALTSCIISTYHIRSACMYLVSLTDSDGVGAFNHGIGTDGNGIDGPTFCGRFVAECNGSVAGSHRCGTTCNGIIPSGFRIVANGNGLDSLLCGILINLVIVRCPRTNGNGIRGLCQTAGTDGYRTIAVSLGLMKRIRRFARF